jgi:hypothetical protein
MTRTWKTVIPVALLSVWLAAGSAWGADTYDWVTARKTAERASSSRDKEAAWGDLAYIHLRLAQYYKQLTAICAQAQISAAHRRADYDGSSAAAATHAFLAEGHFDSAATWAGRNPALRPLQQFAQTQAQGGQFAYGEAASPATEVALAGLHASGGASSLNALAGKLPKSNPVGTLLLAIISNDISALADALAKVEKALAAPAGIDAPLLDQFGDPLVYSALSRAHALLGADVCGLAAAEASAGSIPFFRFLGGLALYDAGDYARAKAELNAATETDVAGIAYAYLAGIEYDQGNRAAAKDLAAKSLDAERAMKRGEALVALARVQAGVGAADWGTVNAARQVIRAKPDSRAQMYAAYWAVAQVSAEASLDSAKQMFWHAADKRKPDVGHGFPDIYCSQQELFCTNYIAVLTRGGSRGNGSDYLDAFNGLMELSKQIPASEPLKEGLRWLSLVTNEDNEAAPRP